METNVNFKDLEGSHYRTSIEMLVNHYNKYITLYGTYRGESRHIFIKS